MSRSNVISIPRSVRQMHVPTIPECESCRRRSKAERVAAYRRTHYFNLFMRWVPGFLFASIFAVLAWDSLNKAIEAQPGVSYLGIFTAFALSAVSVAIAWHTLGRSFSRSKDEGIFYSLPGVDGHE